MGPSKSVSYLPLISGKKPVFCSSQSSNVNDHQHAIFSAATCHSIVLLILILSPLVVIFFFNFTVIQHENRDEYLSYENRAELYSIDEYLHHKQECALCSSLDRSSFEKNVKTKKFNLVCYYNYPTYQNSVELYPENITCDLCTHIIVGFASIQNNTLKLSENLIRTIPKLLELKKCNKNLKIILTIGGSSPDNSFSEMVLDHAHRKEFIKSAKYVLNTYKLDGIDLDWEFPVYAQYKQNNYYGTGKNNLYDKKQRQHFSQLLREIRMEYIREKKNYLLSVAVAAAETIVNVAYDVEEINKYVDFINMMSYDFHSYTKYTPFTGFNSPLYKKEDEKFYLSTLNINYTAHLWASKGMDRNKIMIGLPTYGHSFLLMNSNNVIPGSPANGFGELGHLGFVDFRELCGIFDNKSTKLFFDNETYSPYLVSKSDWVSYENMESMISKSNFIKYNDFGGAMIYSLNSDDFNGKCSKDSGVPFYLTNYVKNSLLDDDL